MYLFIIISMSSWFPILFKQIITCFSPFNFNAEFVQTWFMGGSPFKLASVSFWHARIFFDYFLAFWHEIFQAHLLFFLPQPRN